MDILASRLNRMQEYAIRTVGGYFISYFHTSKAFSGQKTFRLHFRREQEARPACFDVAIHYSNEFIVDYKDPDQETQRLSFPDHLSVIEYLETK